MAEGWAESFSNSLDLSTLTPVTSLADYFKMTFNENFDQLNGGLMEEPKFTYFKNFSTFLNLGYIPVDFVEKTVTKILTSHLFDFVEGGVHRYSTKKDWSKPHYEKLLIDQIYFLQILTQLYVKTGKSVYKEAADFNLKFIFNSLYDDELGVFYTGIDAGEIGEDGMYYYFSDNLLDQITPLTFLPYPVFPGYNSVSLVYAKDLPLIDRSVLLSARNNSKFKLKKDIYVSIYDQAEMLRLFELFDFVFKTNYVQQYTPKLLAFLSNKISNSISLSEALYMYDVFYTFKDQSSLVELKQIIESKVTSKFPYDIYSFPINAFLLNPDYIDQYSYNQSVFYLLKYYDHLDLPHSKPDMCSSIKKSLVAPWYQVTYVDSLRKFCL